MRLKEAKLKVYHRWSKV